MADGQLTGVRVLDFGIWRPVPYATQLLADLGADVIHVEPPAGDPMRAFPELFATVASHKQHLSLDLRSDEGLATALRLAADADVVTEGFRPGVADRLGIGPAAVHAVNPRAVFCSVSGYGQSGPYAQVPGHDANYQALAGSLAMLGFTTTPSIPLADLTAGLAAAFAICAALVRAGRTGQGERIDVAMTDVLASWALASGPATVDGKAGGSDGVAGYGIFPVADGSVVLGVVNEDHFWHALCDALELPDLHDVSAADRFTRSTELNAVLAARLAPLTREQVLAQLEPRGVPVSPVLAREEVLALPAFTSRGLVAPVGVGHPVVFGHVPARTPQPNTEPAAPTAQWPPR